MCAYVLTLACPVVLRRTPLLCYCRSVSIIRNLSDHCWNECHKTITGYKTQLSLGQHCSVFSHLLCGPGQLKINRLCPGLPKSICFHLTLRTVLGPLSRTIIRTSFFLWLDSPRVPVPPHCRGFTITLRHTTLGRPTLDE
jgi:hypothetical protein